MDSILDQALIRARKDKGKEIIKKIIDLFFKQEPVQSHLKKEPLKYLLLAALSGDEELLTYMINLGININSIDTYGTTILDQLLSSQAYQAEEDAKYNKPKAYHKAVEVMRKFGAKRRQELDDSTGAAAAAV